MFAFYESMLDVSLLAVLTKALICALVCGAGLILSKPPLIISTNPSVRCLFVENEL